MNRARTLPLVLGLLLLAMAVTAGPAPASSLSASLTVTDSGAPDSFSFIFSLPIAPLSGPTIATLTVSGTLTDGGVDGVSITPVLPDADGDGIAELARGSTGLGSPTVTLAEAGLAASVAGAYGPFTVGPIAGPSGPFDVLGLSISFLLSGGGDSASLSATLTLEEAPSVPWSGGLWLMGAGLGALALARRRRA